MSDSLWPHGLYPIRLFCPPLSPGACWNSCSLSLWYIYQIITRFNLYHYSAAMLLSVLVFAVNFSKKAIILVFFFYFIVVRTLNMSSTLSINLLLLFSHSVKSDSVTPWTTAHQASLVFTISDFAQTPVHWVSDSIQPSHPLLIPSPPKIFVYIIIDYRYIVLQQSSIAYSFNWLKLMPID